MFITARQRGLEPAGSDDSFDSSSIVNLMSKISGGIKDRNTRKQTESINEAAEKAIKDGGLSAEYKYDPTTGNYAPTYKSPDAVTEADQALTNLRRQKGLTEQDRRRHPEKYRNTDEFGQAVKDFKNVPQEAPAATPASGEGAGMFQKLAGMLKGLTGMGGGTAQAAEPPATAAVNRILAPGMNQVGMNQAGMDQAGSADPMLEQEARSELQAAGLPETPENIAEAVRQLTEQKAGRAA